MRILSLFGTLFLFFWAVPFPMLMYYNTGFATGSSPTLALVWLGLSVLVWGYLMYRLFNALVLGRVHTIQHLNNLMTNGQLVKATIVNALPMPEEVKGINKYQLTVSFPNFVGTQIEEKILINDKHPDLHRYENGKTLDLRVDKKLKNDPHLQVDGAHYTKAPGRTFITTTVVWLIAVGIVVWYYIFSYHHESAGSGWRFMVFYHPLLLCPLIMLVLNYFFGGKKLTRNQLQHKYYGYKTQAHVISAVQTGVYINQQPQVRFNLQFTDHNGQLQQAAFTRTIGVLDTNFAQQKDMDVFYLQNNPQDVCLARDIQP